MIVNCNQLGGSLLRSLGQDEGQGSRAIESWVESGENGAGVMTQCGVHKDMATGLDVPGCLAENGDLACCIMCAIWVRHFAQHRAMCALMANNVTSGKLALTFHAFLKTRIQKNSSLTISCESQFAMAAEYLKIGIMATYTTQ